MGNLGNKAKLLDEKAPLRNITKGAETSEIILTANKYMEETSLGSKQPPWASNRNREASVNSSELEENSTSTQSDSNNYESVATPPQGDT